jgi:hypothetical protein
MTPETREAYKSLNSVKTPNLANFFKELRGIFTESVDMDLGSRQELERLIKKNFTLDFGDLQRISVYNQDFRVLSAKLMKEPAILSNTKAVKAYLLPMSQRLVQAITAQLVQMVSPAKRMSRRREDPYLLSEVMGAAESTEFGASLDTYYGTGPDPNGPFGVPPSAESHSRGTFSFPFAPQLPLAQSSAATIKVEPKQEQWSEVLAGIASIKDTIVVNKKETTSLLDSHQKAIASLMNLMKANPESVNRSSYASAQAAPQASKVPDWGQGCFMCGSLDHRMMDCQFFNSYKEKGWLVPDTTPGSKKYTLRDGSPIPRHDPNESRPEKISRIAKQKGWDKGGTNAFFVEEDDMLVTEEQGPHYASVSALLAKLIADHNTNGQALTQNTDSEESGN